MSPSCTPNHTPFVFKSISPLSKKKTNPNDIIKVLFFLSESYTAPLQLTVTKRQLKNSEKILIFVCVWYIISNYCWVDVTHFFIWVWISLKMQLNQDLKVQCYFNTPIPKVRPTNYVYLEAELCIDLNSKYSTLILFRLWLSGFIGPDRFFFFF